MLFPELFHRLLDAGATEIRLEVIPEYKVCEYRLTWSFAGSRYGYQHIVSDLEFASSLSALEHTLDVLSDNAMTSIHHAKSIIVFKESK